MKINHLSTSATCQILGENESIFSVHIWTYVIKLSYECMFNAVNKYFRHDDTENDGNHGLNVSCIKKTTVTTKP